MNPPECVRNCLLLLRRLQSPYFFRFHRSRSLLLLHQTEMPLQLKSKTSKNEPNVIPELNLRPGRCHFLNPMYLHRMYLHQMYLHRMYLRRMYLFRTHPCLLFHSRSQNPVPINLSGHPLLPILLLYPRYFLNLLYSVPELSALLRPAFWDPSFLLLFDCYLHLKHFPALLHRPPEPYPLL